MEQIRKVMEAYNSLGSITYTLTNVRSVRSLTPEEIDKIFLVINKAVAILESLDDNKLKEQLKA